MDVFLKALRINIFKDDIQPQSLQLRIF